MFGFASAGVPINGLSADCCSRCRSAILLGLFLGKQLGVFGAIWIAVKTGYCQAPAGTQWLQIYGASLLCGIGFTMSLFIGALAFPFSAARSTRPRSARWPAPCLPRSRGGRCSAGAGRQLAPRTNARSGGTVRGQADEADGHGPFPHPRTANSHCEEVELGDIAREIGTPVYVYSSATIRHHARIIRRPWRGSTIR